MPDKVREHLAPAVGDRDGSSPEHPRPLKEIMLPRAQYEFHMPYRLRNKRGLRYGPLDGKLSWVSPLSLHDADETCDVYVHLEPIS